MSPKLAKLSKAKRAIKQLNAATREAAVVNCFTKLLDSNDFKIIGNLDGLYKNVLFEFKQDKNLSSKAVLCEAIAQACYYLRQLWLQEIDNVDTFPSFLAIVDKNEACVVEVKALMPIITRDSYNWHNAATDADLSLVRDVYNELTSNNLNYTYYKYTNEKNAQDLVEFLEFVEKAPEAKDITRSITRTNFLNVYRRWRRIFNIENEDQAEIASAYLADLQLLGAINERLSTVVFTYEGKTITLYGDIEQYKTFWASYYRPPTPDEMQAIINRKDQLVSMFVRRKTGEFFTPLYVAELAHEYFLKCFPTAYDDEIPWWDCCCGTGNLTVHVPRSKMNLWLSTLNAEDLEVLKSTGQNPQAKTFQFDMLNDPLDKLPKEFTEQLKEYKALYVLINPPFVAKTAGSFAKRNAKKVSAVLQTEVQKRMKKAGISTHNTVLQFLYRLWEISEEYDCKLMLGAFSKLGHFMQYKSLPFMNYWLREFVYLSGFVFTGTVFSDTTGNWPCAFTVWEKKHG